MLRNRGTKEACLLMALMMFRYVMFKAMSLLMSSSEPLRKALSNIGKNAECNNLFTNSDVCAHC